MNPKREGMMAFWSERVGRFGTDPRSNTNDIWLREVELEAVEEQIAKCCPSRVLDFGCANGYTTVRLARNHPQIRFLGVDINPDMIDAAKEGAAGLGNVVFTVADVLADDIGDCYDMAVAIRVFQNLESLEMQTRIFDRLLELLKPGGFLYFIESYEEGYARLNADRRSLDLPPLPIHPHLTLLSDAFDGHVASRAEIIERGAPSSTYYLVTRLVYSRFAADRGEEIDYDHLLHRIAAAIPQFGDYGPQKSRLVRKPHGIGQQFAGR
jgi:SAM-dependent methyltransferase